MNMPNFPSSYHEGNGLLSNESQSGVYWPKATTDKQLNTKKTANIVTTVQISSIGGAHFQQKKEQKEKDVLSSSDTP